MGFFLGGGGGGELDLEKGYPICSAAEKKEGDGEETERQIEESRSSGAYTHLAKARTATMYIPCVSLAAMCYRGVNVCRWVYCVYSA